MYGSSRGTLIGIRDQFANAYFSNPNMGDGLGLSAIPNTHVLDLTNEELTERATAAMKYDSLLAYYLHDEPDGRDYRADRPLPLRIGHNAQLLVDKANLLRRLDPHHLHFLEINNTFKPLNWYIYGPIADLPCTDPYAIADALTPLTLRFVVHAMDTLCAAAAPRASDVAGVPEPKERLPTPADTGGGADHAPLCPRLRRQRPQLLPPRLGPQVSWL